MSMKQRGELCFFLSKHCVSLPCKLPIFIFNCYLPILNSDLAEIFWKVWFVLCVMFLFKYFLVGNH